MSLDSLLKRIGRRPPEVSELAKRVYQAPRRRVEKILSELGWLLEREVETSRAWWVRKNIQSGTIEVMIAFGGPLDQAHAFSWRETGGPAERI